MRETANRITPYLRRLKEKDGRTQSEIAEAADVNANTIGKYFSGIDDDSANFEIVRKLVASMGGSLDEMAGIAPPDVSVDEEKLTTDGYTETEIKAILRWSGSEISRTYKAIVSGLEGRLKEKDERLTHRDALAAEEHRRTVEEIEYERRRTMEEIAQERRRARIASIISYIVLGLFVLLFYLDFLLPTVGWIKR